MTLVLSNDEIEEHYPMRDCVDAIEAMYDELGRGRAVTDAREDVLTPLSGSSSDSSSGSSSGSNGSPEYPTYHLLKTMSGALRDLGVAAVRINSNLLTWGTKGGSLVREKETPETGRHTGFVLLFDIETGEALALFPDGIVQSYRVAATSAVASKHLSVEGVADLGMLGSGWQARAHVAAFDAVHDLDRIRVYSPSADSRTEFCEEMDGEVDATVTPVDSPEAVFDRSETVQCATNALEPVFEREWIDPGTHVGIINDDEAPASFFEFDWFDCFAQSWESHEVVEEVGTDLSVHGVPSKNILYYVAGDYEDIPELAGAGNADTGTGTDAEDGSDGGHGRENAPSNRWEEATSLARIVAGDAPGRRHPEDVTAFYNRGFGLQFASVGKSVYDAAIEKDLGRTIPTEIFTQEIQGV